MATTGRRKNSLTKFLEDIVDDTKDLVDDLIDRAKDVEENARDTVRDAVADDDDRDDGPSSEELAQLRDSLAALTAKVNELSQMRDHSSSADK
jgi:methyl-accepting chemotaxis protein